MCVYGDDTQRTWLEEEWKKTGKKLDMGKSCIRFRSAEDLPLDLITKTVARIPVKAFLARYEEALCRGREQEAGAKLAPYFVRPPLVGLPRLAAARSASVLTADFPDRP